MFYIGCGLVIALIWSNKWLKRLYMPLYTRIVIERKEAIRRKGFAEKLEKVATYREKKGLVHAFLFDHPAGLSKKDYLIFLEHLNGCAALDDLHRTLLLRIEDFSDVSKNERNSILKKYRHLKENDHNYLVDFMYDRIKTKTS